MNNAIKESIERLISEENNPTERARLLILLQISNSLSDLSQKNQSLEKEIKTSEEYINLKRRADDRYAGARKLAASLFFVVQSASGWFLYQIYEVPKKITADLVALERRVFVVENKIIQSSPTKDLIK